MRTSVLFRILVFLALAFPVLAVNAGAAVPWSEEDCNSFTFPSNPTQRDVLQKFYCDTGGPSWTNKNRWGAATLSNDWHGIFFDSGNVIDISLNGNQLTGTIPAELGSLTSLTALYLDQNQLSGTIPTELGSLTNMLNLHLWGNQLSGTIPAELGSLTNLMNLHLWGNQLTGTIPAELGDLTKLTHSRLDQNRLSGTIPSELGDLTGLEMLQISGNQLSGTIPTELGSLTNMLSLHLWGNQLSGTIPVELGSLTSLEGFSLSRNQLSGTIPTELGSLTSLRWLYLNANDLTGTIPSELGDLTGLWWLYLWGNQLSGTIPSQLGNIAGLWRLVLHDNQLSGTIPTELGSLTNLQWLYLHANDLTGTIPTELGSLTNLQWLYLHANDLTGTVPTGLDGLTSLLEFSSWLNSSLTQPTDSTYSSLLPKLDRAALRFIYTENNGVHWTNKENWLSGAVSETWNGVTLDGNNRVTGLDLSDNNLSGEMSGAFAGLLGLTALNLSGNTSLGGTLPTELMGVSGLETLNVQCTGVAEPSDTGFQNWLTSLGDDYTNSLCPTPSVSFMGGNFRERENLITRNVTVSLSSPAPADGLAVSYTVGGTAAAGTDFSISGSGTVQAPAGATRVDIAVQIREDSEDEPEETVVLTLAAREGYDLGGGPSALTIHIEDDDPTTATLSGSGSDVAEGGTKAITVTLGRGLARDERLELPLTTAGDAERGTDYRVSGTPAKGISYNDNDNVESVIFRGPKTGVTATVARMTFRAINAGGTVDIGLGQPTSPPLDGGTTLRDNLAEFSITDSTPPPTTTPPPAPPTTTPPPAPPPPPPEDECVIKDTGAGMFAANPCGEGRETVSHRGRSITLDLSIEGSVDAGPDQWPSIVLSSDILDRVETVSFRLLVPSQEPPEGFGLRGPAAEIGLGGVTLAAGESAEVCLAAPAGAAEPLLYLYAAAGWEPVSGSAEKTVGNVRSVCGVVSSLPSLFGVFVMEEVPEPPAGGGGSGGGCSLASDEGRESGLPGAALGLLLIISCILATPGRIPRHLRS